MVNWNRVEFIVDETVCCPLDVNRVLYDIRTLAKICPRSSENDFPPVLSAVTGKKICLAIGSTVLIFSDGCRELDSVLDLDANVECLSLSDDGEFLIVACSDGCLNVMYIPRGKCLLSQHLVTKSEEFDRAFSSVCITPVDDNGCCSIIIFTAYGDVFQFENVCLKDLRTAIEEAGDNYAKVCEVLQSVTKLKVNIECCSGQLFSSLDKLQHLLIVGEDIAMLTFPDLSIKHSLSTDYLFEKIIKIKVIATGLYAFVLDNQNSLHVLCMKTFLVVEDWREYKIIDFTLLEIVDYRSYLDVKLVTIVGKENGQHSLQLHDFPSFALIYCIDVEPFCHLIDIPVNQDAVFFLEGIAADKDEVSFIRIGELSEALPEARLSRLLNTRKFNEAFDFARCFGLNAEIVYKTKVNYLLEQFPTSLEVTLSNEVMRGLKEELFGCLDKIKDVDAVVNFCINASLPKLEDVLEMLLYAKKKLRTMNKIDEKLACQILNRIVKLETFAIISGLVQLGNAWKGDYEVDMWKEFLMYLSQGKMNVVSVIWSRHHYDFLTTFSAEHVLAVLNSTAATSANSTVFNSWLITSFFPVVICGLPHCLEIVVSWTINRCRTMELDDKKHWPVNAICFAESVNEVLQKCCSGTSLRTFVIGAAISELMTNDNPEDNCGKQIKQLLDNLRDLRELRVSYGCRISLDDFSQEDKKEVCCNLLMWVDIPEKIAPFIKGFLQKYATQYGLCVDQVLCYYVKNVFLQTEFAWLYCEEVPWEKEMISVIDCISDEDCWLKSIIEMLKSAPVPWSASIERLVEKCLDVDHPLVFEIKDQIKRIDLKVVLSKYGLQKYNISATHSAEIAVNYIVKQNGENSWGDVLTVVKFFPDLSEVDANLCRLRHLMVSEKIEEFLSWLKGMSAQISTVCCKRVTIFVEELLMRNNCWKLLSNRKGFFYVRCAICCLAHLKRILHLEDWLEYSALHVEFTRMSALQADYGMFLSFEELRSSGKCKDIFLRCVHCFLDTDGQSLGAKEELSLAALAQILDKKYSPLSFSLSQLLRLSSLLGLKKESAVEIVAKESFEKKNFPVVLQCCDELCFGKMDHIGAAVVFTLVKYFVGHLQFQFEFMPSTVLSEITAMLTKLLSRVVLYGDADVYERCAALSHFLWILDRSCNCYLPDQDLGFTMSSFRGVDPYKHWVFSPMYNENANPDGASVLLLVGNLVNFLFADNDEADTRDNIAALSVAPRLVMHLHRKGQNVLACHAFQVVFELLIKRGSNEVNSFFEHGRFDEFQCDLMGKMIQTAFAQQRVDKAMLEALFLSIPRRSQVLKYLYTFEKRCGFDYRKLQVLADVGRCYAERCNYSVSDIKHFAKVAKLAEWGRRLARWNISFKEVHRGLEDNGNRLKLICEIAHHPKMTVSLFEDYCTDFALDLDESLAVLLESLLTKEVVDVSSVAFQRLLNLCTQAVDKFHGRQLCLSTLRNILERVNPYNYEVILFVLEHMKKVAASLIDVEDLRVAEKGLSVLDFLKMYRRVEKPSDSEFGLFLVCDEKKFGERLPFHEISGDNCLNLIYRELNTTNIDLWLHVTPLIVGTKDPNFRSVNDGLLLNAVENTVSRVLRRVSRDPVWTDVSYSSKLLEAVFDLLWKVDNFKTAAATAFHIVKKLPPSSAKIVAADNAIKLAYMWSEKMDDKDASRAIDFFQSVYTKLFSECVLRTYGLAQPQYLALCGEPNALITELYNDSSVVERYWLRSDRYPDIHGVCQRLASNTSCDLDAIFNGLSEKWLTPTYCGDIGGGGVDAGLDDTIVQPLDDKDETNRVSSTDYNRIDDDNLKRCIYLLKLGLECENVMHVADWIFSETSDVSKSFKFRAVTCLLHGASSETIACYSKMTRMQLLNLGKSLLCASQLEAVLLPSESVDLGDVAAVKSLVIHLLQASGRNSKALELAADLCLESKIFVAQIWNTIFQNMIELNMYECLSRKLVLLPNNAEIVWLPTFSIAWNFVLKAPIDSNSPVIDRLVLLHSCQSFLDLDVVALSDSFRHMNLPVLAVDCLIHIIDPVVRDNCLTEFLKPSMIEPLLEQLKELTEALGDLYHLDKVTSVAIEKFTSNLKSVGALRRSVHYDWFLGVVKEFDDTIYQHLS